MANVLAFGASTSKNSINKKLAGFVASKFSSSFELLDLNEFAAPLFSVDLEQSSGIPEAIKKFNSKIQSCDALVISLAEHNGSYTVAFKNIFDWSSRANAKVFEGKKVFLLATSPGPRGGLGVLEAAATRFPFHGAQIVEKFSLPSFGQNFGEDGIKDPTLKSVLDAKVKTFLTALQKE